MRDYSKISPKFWIGKTGKKLRSSGMEAQLVSLYLMTCPHANMLGLFYCPISYVAHETGLTLEGATKGLASSIEAGFCEYDEASEIVWVIEMAEYQIAATLKAEDKRCAGVQNEYNDLPDNPFMARFFDKYSAAFNMTKSRGEVAKKPSPLKAPSKPLASQEQEQEQEQEENTLSGKPDETPRQEEQAKPKNKTAEDVLDYLNKVAGTNYQPVKANIDLIAGRMKEGATVEIMKAVIDSKFSEWSGDRKYAKYIRPATLFNATKFAQYSGECSPKKRSGNNNYRMHHLGFVEVHSVMGGMSSWSATGYRSIEEYENAQLEAA